MTIRKHPGNIVVVVYISIHSTGSFNYLTGENPTQFNYSSILCTFIRFYLPRGRIGQAGPCEKCISIVMMFLLHVGVSLCIQIDCFGQFHHPLPLPLPPSLLLPCI